MACMLAQNVQNKTVKHLEYISKIVVDVDKSLFSLSLSLSFDKCFEKEEKLFEFAAEKVKKEFLFIIFIEVFFCF